MLARDRQQLLVENGGHSSLAACLAAFQLIRRLPTIRDTWRRTMRRPWLAGGKVGMSGCTWVAECCLVGPSVQSALNVFFIFCVLVECARFGRQQGHVGTERVQWSTVAGCCLTQLLCYLCNFKKRFENISGKKYKPKGPAYILQPLLLWWHLQYMQCLALLTVAMVLYLQRCWNRGTWFQRLGGSLQMKVGPVDSTASLV